jgi:hypothetical protein
MSRVPDASDSGGRRLDQVVAVSPAAVAGDALPGETSGGVLVGSGTNGSLTAYLASNNAGLLMVGARPVRSRSRTTDST